MKLVLQHPYPKACQLACIAMIENVSLEQVILMAGTNETPSHDVLKKLAKEFSRDEVYGSRRIKLEPFGGNALGYLMKHHRTMIASLHDALDVHFAHSVIIHDKQLYDPHFGMNPSYTWHRYFSAVQPIEARGV